MRALRSISLALVALVATIFASTGEVMAREARGYITVTATVPAICTIDTSQITSSWTGRTGMTCNHTSVQAHVTRVQGSAAVPGVGAEPTTRTAGNLILVAY